MSEREERKWERRRGGDGRHDEDFLYDWEAVRIIDQQGKGVRLRGEEWEEGFSESIHHMFAYMGRRRRRRGCLLQHDILLYVRS